MGPCNKQIILFDSALLLHLNQLMLPVFLFFILIALYPTWQNVSFSFIFFKNISHGGREQSKKKKKQASGLPLISCFNKLHEKKYFGSNNRETYCLRVHENLLGMKLLNAL